MNWDLIKVALSEYGLKEVAGSGNNPEILQMAKDCGFVDYVADSTAWCSLFANWVCLKAGYERSKSLAARSWLTVGQPVDNAEDADIVVFWRDDPNGPFGHVGFPIKRDNAFQYTLAGNQGDMVNIEGFGLSRILGYRKLAKVNL
jgi:uncharacterized protein (TIGR02594 family)